MLASLNKGYNWYQAILPNISFNESGDTSKNNFFTEKTPKNRHKDDSLNPTILLVEDNELIQLCHRKFCEQLNCHVITAFNALEALELYHSLKPDLILLDICLPHISGTDVCRLIRQQEKNTRIPIIAVTAHGDEAEEECRTGGLDDFVTKPLLPDALKKLLHQWLPQYRSVIDEVRHS